MDRTKTNTNIRQKRPHKDVENSTNEELCDHLFTKTAVAPWLCREEWMAIYYQIAPVLASPESATAFESLNLDKIGRIIDACWCKAWEARNEAAQTTVIVMKALKALYSDEHTALLSASMAVIRFIKTVSEAKQQREFPRRSIKEICESLGVPAWLVQIRHDGSHGEMQEPSELNDALIFAVRWLNTHFWDVELQRINTASYMVKTSETDDDWSVDADAKMIVKIELQNMLKEMQQLENVHEPERFKRKRKLVDRYLRELHFYIVTYPDAFVDVLVTRFLAPIEVSLQEFGEATELSCTHPEIPARLFHDWILVVQNLLTHPAGADRLLRGLTRIVGDPCHDRDYLACAWCRVVLDKIPRNGLSSTRLWDFVKWTDIAEILTERPSPYSGIILQKINAWVSNNKELLLVQRSIRLVKILAQPMISTNSIGVNFNNKENTPVHTLKDLLQELNSGTKKVTASASEFGCDPKQAPEPISAMCDGLGQLPVAPSVRTLRWIRQTCTDINWSNVPIGILPWQNNQSRNLHQTLLLSDPNLQQPLSLPDPIPTNNSTRSKSRGCLL